MGNRTKYIRGTAEERFWPKVDKSSDCWLWMGACHDYGYGRFNIGGGRIVPSHRFAYEALVGPIPIGLELDHRPTCPKNCVNPEHLRPATRKQNLENMPGARSHSKSGIRGVSQVAGSGTWCVRVSHNNVRYWGGCFAEIADAEAAAIELRNRLFTHNYLDRISA
jgi:hypothetical protein